MLSRYLTKNSIIAGALLGVTVAALNDYMLYIFAGAVFLAFLWMTGEELLVPLSIFLLLSFGSDVGETVRELMNVFSVGILIYLIAVRQNDFKAKLKLLPLSALYFILFVLLSLFISTAFSEHPAIGLLELIRQIVFLALCFLIFLLYDPHRDTLKIINSIIFSGLAVSIFTLYSFVSSPDNITQLLIESYVKEGGLFKNIAAAGGILMVSTSLTLTVIIADKIGKGVNNYPYWGIFFIQVVGFLLTNSRAAFLGFTLASLIMLLIINRKLFLRIFLISSLFSIFIFVVSDEASETLFNFLRLGRVLENTRYLLWDMMYKMIGDNPIFGIGPGTTRFYLSKYINVMWGSWNAEQLLFNFEKGVIGQAHNFYLFRWVELGIPGLLSALVLPILYFYYSNTVRSFVRSRDKYNALLFDGIFCLGIGFFVRGFFEATGIMTNGWISRDLPFWLLFLLAMVHYRALQTGEEPELSGENSGQ